MRMRVTGWIRLLRTLGYRIDWRLWECLQKRRHRINIQRTRHRDAGLIQFEPLEPRQLLANTLPTSAPENISGEPPRLAMLQTSTEEISNLAVHGLATQSSTGWSGSASRAIDGNSDGYWSHRSVTHTQNQTNSWWQVDLQDVAAVDNIQIYNRNEVPIRLTNFRVSVWNADPATGGTELWGRDFGSGLWNTNPNNPLVISADSLGDNGVALDQVAARFIRIQFNGRNQQGTGYLSLAEVEVNGARAERGPESISFTTASTSLSFDDSESLFYNAQGSPIASPKIGTVTSLHDPLRGAVASFSSNSVIQLNSANRPELAGSWTLFSRFRDLKLESNNWNTLFRGGSDHQLLIHPSTNELGYYDHDTQRRFIGTDFFMTAFDDNRWHSAAVVSNGSEIQYFIDGFFVGAITDLSTSKLTSINGVNSSSPQTFATYLDDFQYFDTALTPTEVATLAADDLAQTFVAENSPTGTWIGSFTASDPNPNDGLSYRLDNSANGRFAIDSLTGAVTVADVSRLDTNVADQHSITVRATDAAGLSFVKTVSIGVTGDQNRLGNPITRPGFVDSWRATMIIDEAKSYTNQSTSTEFLQVDNFSAFVGNNRGRITPFLVKVSGPNVFHVVAIGTTRQSGNDYHSIGEFEWSFSGESTVIALAPGEKIAAGFTNANANGGGVAGSVVSYLNAPGNVWFTGSYNTNQTGTLAVGSSPRPGRNVYPDVARVYQFNISLEKVASPISDTSITSGILQIGMATLGGRAVELSTIMEGGQSKVAINGVATNVLASSVTGIRFFGSEQDDQIDFRNVHSTTFPNLEANGIMIAGGAGNDQIYDVLDAVFGTEIFGGDGSDTIYGGPGANDIDGGRGDDSIFAGGGNDVVVGGAGNDQIFGGDGQDVLLGGQGNDSIEGGRSGDVVVGGTGDDNLRGGHGSDELWGEDGDDRLAGGTAIDDLHGGDGSDDERESDEPDPLRPPNFDDVSISVRQSEAASIRLLAEDVETPLDQLTFSIVNVVGPTTLRLHDDYGLENGIFEWHPRVNHPVGNWQFAVRATDRDSNFTDAVLSATIVGYNQQRPVMIADKIYVDYQYSAAGQIPWVEPDLNNNTSPKTISFLKNDSQTLAKNLSYSGDLNSNGQLVFDIDDYVGEHKVFKLTIRDDGARDGEKRNQTYDYHLVVDKFVRDSYADVTHPNTGITTYQGVGDILVDAIGVAFDVEAKVAENVGQSPSVDIVPSIRYAGYDDQRLGSGFGRGNLDPSAAPNRLRYNSISSDDGTITNFDDRTGTFTFVPDVGFEGLTKIKYSFEYPIFKYDHDSDPDVDDHDGFLDLDVMVERRTTDEGTIYIQVGNAVDVDLAFAGLDEADEQSGSGLLIPLNDDDDNQNNRPDHLDLDGVQPEEEGELIPIEVQVKLNRDDVKRTDFTGHFAIYTSGVGADRHIRLWADPKKQQEIFATTFKSFAGIENQGQSYALSQLPGTIYVEGLTPGIDTLTLTVQPTDRAFEGIETISEVANAGIDNSDFDEMVITSFEFDLDIDSDNNGFIEDSDWEEELEVNKYALGKLVPTFAGIVSYPFIDFDQFTPIQIRVPGALYDSLDLKIRLDFSDIETDAGQIKLFRLPKGHNEEVDPTSRIFVSPGVEYSLNTFDYRNGTIALYVEGTLGSDIVTLGRLKRLGKPNETIKATLISGSSELSDEVKYIVAKPNSIFWAIQERPELRASFASKGVYDLNDLPNYALEILTNEKLAELEIPAHIKRYLNKNGGSSGFKAALYRDYVAGPNSYFVAFAGTDMKDLDDWANNASQVLAGGSPQFSDAMVLAQALYDEMPELEMIGKDFEIVATGHSLGGGLASAAAVWAGLTGRATGLGKGAYTFNASGLTLATITNENNRLELQELTKREGVEERFNQASKFIDAYYNNMDMLSLAQDSKSIIPSAIGHRYEIDGPYRNDNNAVLAADALQQFLRKFVVVDSQNRLTYNGNFEIDWFTVASLIWNYEVLLDGQRKITASHGFYQYGLLQDLYGPWLRDDGSFDPDAPVGFP